MPAASKAISERNVQSALEEFRFLAPAVDRAIPFKLAPPLAPMDHPCHKCGHDIEDGKAFCSQCGAPQIRVVLPDVPLEVLAGGGTAFPALMQEGDAGIAGVPVGPLSTRWAYAMRPCALAASVAVVLLFLGLWTYRIKARQQAS